MTSRQHDSIEVRRQTVQAQFDASRSREERNQLGQFATPHALAVEIAEYVRDIAGASLKAIHFADPSLGTGSFFSAILGAFGSNRISGAVGVELDPTLCGAARRLWRGYPIEVVCNDFTRWVAESAPARSPNLILANPPYVRHHHLRAEDKKRLQALVHRTTGIKVSGLAGLYVYFFLLATSWLEKDGIAAWLVPSEFMDVNYGSALRDYLTERVTLIRAHRFDPTDMQFGDALVSSAILVLRNAPPPLGHAPLFTVGGSLATPNAEETIQLERLRKSRKWTAFPNHSENDRQTKTGVDEPELGDFFRIKRGIATGNNKFFVLDRIDAKHRGLPSQFLKPILPSPRRLQTRIVRAAPDGYPHLNPQLCVIDCDLDEATLQSQHPLLWEYLKSGESLGVRERYLVSKRTPWYKQERREPSAFLCTYMGRGSGSTQPVRFILNRSQAIVTNLYLMLYPRPALAEIIGEDPDAATEVFALLEQVTGNELRGEGRVYGGGLNKIEPSELARISAASLVKRWPQLHASIDREQTLLFV